MFFSIFSEGCRAAWTDVHETQPSRTKCRPSKTEEVAVLVWAGPILSHEMRLDPRKLPKIRFCVAPLCFDRQNCGDVRLFGVWMVLPRSSCNKCISIVEKKKGEIYTLLALANPLAQNASRSSRAVVKFRFRTCLLNSFAQNWCPPSDIM